MDCLEGMKQLDDKIAQITFWDAPYNINKANWDKIDNYIEWCGVRIKECERITKYNGSFYLCHNDFDQLAELHRWITRNTYFKLQIPLIWNKRFHLSSATKKKSPKHGFLTGFIVREGKRNYEMMYEFVLYYAFDNGRRIREERKKRGLSQKVLAEKVLSESGGVTGWMSNIELERSCPNEEHIKIINEILGLEDVVTRFHNLGTYHAVWDIDMVGRSDPNDHETPKPNELIKTILRHSTDQGDLVLIPFSGGASSEVVCAQMKRDFISFEIDEGYCKAGNKKINGRQKIVDEFFS